MKKQTREVISGESLVNYVNRVLNLGHKVEQLRALYQYVLRLCFLCVWPGALSGRVTRAGRFPGLKPRG
jgi:hypothetical protein